MLTFEPLWKTLLNKGISKTQLREMTGISTATLSKLSKNEYVSMQVLDTICNVLHVKSIIEVVEFTSNASTTLDNIEYVINKLSNNKLNNIKADDKDIFLLYLTMEEFITNEMEEETKDNNDKFLDLYSKCFREKLLPQDLLDSLNHMLKKQLF